MYTYFLRNENSETNLELETIAIIHIYLINEFTQS